MKALLRHFLVGGLSIAMAGTGLWTGGAALAVGNAAPTSVAVVVSPTVVVEGDTVTLTVQLDSAATEQLGVQVNWGDASPSNVAFIDPGQIDLSFEHAYLDDAPSSTPQDLLTITVRVESATTSLAASASVLVKNAPPTNMSVRVSPSTITAGSGVTVSGVFEDVGKGDRHGVFIDWGDGAGTGFPRLTSKTYAFDYTNFHTYAVGGTYRVTARVTDDDNGWVEASAQLTVLSTNQAASNLALAMSSVAEGGTSTLTASFTDPDATDTHDISVNWGDGSPTETLASLAAGAAEFTAEHTYDNSGSYAVTVVVNDGGGHSITETTSVSVSNVGPSVNLAPVVSPVAGDNVDLSGTFVDPATADTFTLSVDWGDGTAGTPILGADVRSFTASHTYELAGPYTATVTVTDSDGARGTASADVAVRARNDPPTNLTLSTRSVARGATTTATGTFSDGDTSDTHSVVMSWGDGPPVTFVLDAGATSFTATHAYATAGTWTVTATVTDPAGASTSATTHSVVTAPATTTAELLDELSALVQGLDLARPAERWFLHRITKLKASLARGNDELCEALQGFDRLSSLVRRSLTGEQVEALTELTTKLNASANCSLPQDNEDGDDDEDDDDDRRKNNGDNDRQDEKDSDKAEKDDDDDDRRKNNDDNDRQDKKDSAKAEKDDDDDDDEERGRSRKGGRH